MVALDVGGAIKGQHFDIYQGIGPEAGHRAGWYNHYGRVWVLKTARCRVRFSRRRVILYTVFTDTPG